VACPPQGLVAERRSSFLAGIIPRHLADIFARQVTAEQFHAALKIALETLVKTGKVEVN